MTIAGTICRKISQREDRLLARQGWKAQASRPQGPASTITKNVFSVALSS